MTNSSENTNQKVIKAVRGLGLTNLILGTALITLQFAVDVSYIFNEIDYASSGFWGGCVLITAGGLSLRLAA